MNLYAIPPLLSSILAVLLCILVIIKGKDRKLIIPFTGWCTTIFVWLFSYFICYTIKNQLLATTFARIACTAVMFLANTFYHFIVSFVRLDSERKFVKLAYALSLLQLPFFFFTNLFLSGTHSYYWGYYSKAGILHPLFLAFFFAIFTRGFFILWKAYRIENDPQRKYQIKYVFISFLIALIAAIDFIPKYGFEIYPFGFLFMIIFVITTAYAIIKYHLIEIKLAVSIAGLFLIVYTLVLGTPVWLGFKVKSWEIPTISAIILATIGPVVFFILNKQSEKLLLAQQWNYQNILMQAGRIIFREHRLDNLLEIFVHSITKTVGISHTALYVFNPKSNLYEISTRLGTIEMTETIKKEYFPDKYVTYDLEPIFSNQIPEEYKRYIPDFQLCLMIPSLREKNIFALLFLGKKINKTPYTSNDINVFKILSRNAAVAIENCIIYKEMEDVQDKLLYGEKMASLGGLTIGVTHQINNKLLQIILGADEFVFHSDFVIKKYSNLINEMPELKKDISQFIELSNMIIKNTRSVEFVTKNILDYGKAEAKETFYTNFSLNAIIKIISNLLIIKYRLKEFPLHINIGDNDIVYGIEAQIIEVLYNVFDNCYEAILEKNEMLARTGSEQVEPRITLNLIKSKDAYLIEISDNGIGIKDENKGKLFKPFFTTKTSEKSGTGIGMYVVKRLIEENHKGKVRFSSEYAEGTNISIEIPKIDVPEDQAKPADEV